MMERWWPNRWSLVVACFFLVLLLPSAHALGRVIEFHLEAVQFGKLSKAVVSTTKPAASARWLLVIESP